MKKTLINDKWEILLPDHRAERVEWPFWEKERLQSMSDNVKKGDLVLDIGTEEGDMSALLSMWSGGQIILFEPNPKVWSNVKAIWDANNLVPPLAFYQGFVSNTTTMEQPKDLTEWPESSNDEIVRDHGFKNLSEEGDGIMQIRLDQFMARLRKEIHLEDDRKVGIISIDVEGSEYEVLKGAKQILTFDRPIVFVSVHPELMFHNHHQYERNLHDFMESLSYKSEHLAYDHEHHYIFRPV